MKIGGHTYELVRHARLWDPARGPYQRLRVRFPSITFTRGKIEYSNRAKDDAAQWAKIRAAGSREDLALVTGLNGPRPL